MVGYSDPTGNSNYVWNINEKVPESDMDNRYNVNVVDWANAEKIDPKNNKFVKTPRAFTVPDEPDIYGPTVSPASSKKGSNTPPSGGSDGEGKMPDIYKNTGAGERKSGRIAKKAKEQGTSSQS
jgi:hypothetical protein